MAPARTRQTKAKPPQQQTQRFEVLTETKHGHQTVHRVDATSEQHATELVDQATADTTTVLAAALDGSGLGSGGQTPGGGKPS